MLSIARTDRLPTRSEFYQRLQRVPEARYRSEATSRVILALDPRNSLKNAETSSIGVPLAPIKIAKPSLSTDSHLYTVITTTYDKVSSSNGPQSWTENSLLTTGDERDLNCPVAVGSAQSFASVSPRVKVTCRAFDRFRPSCLRNAT
jgi:hypothetical protein